MPAPRTGRRTCASSSSPRACSPRFPNSGSPFDPREAPAPDLNSALDERDIGGLGLHLLRTLAEGLDYERRDGANLTRFWIRRK